MASLSPWQIAIYEQWASIVKNRHVTSAVFAVRALCPPPLVPLLFILSRGPFFFPPLSRRHTGPLFPLLCLARDGRRSTEARFLPRLFRRTESASPRVLRYRGPDLHTRETTTWVCWLERSPGNDVVTRSREQPRKGSRWQKIRRSCGGPQESPGKRRKGASLQLGSARCNTKEIVALFLSVSELQNRSVVWCDLWLNRSFRIILYFESLVGPYSKEIGGDFWKNGLINLWEMIESSGVFPSQIVGLFYKVFLLIS